MYWQKKGIKRVLTLQFEEGDDILKGIESAMRENGIHEVNIVEATGSIRSGLGNYLNGSQFLTKNFDNSKIKIAAGHFEIKGSIFGVLKIIPADLTSLRSSLCCPHCHADSLVGTDSAQIYGR